MSQMPLKDKTILITGAARRIGRLFALACGRAGANIVIHHGHSQQAALDLQNELAACSAQSWILPSDLSNADEVSSLISKANELAPLYALVNNAAIFENLTLQNTSLADWQRHLSINLTAPFLLSQAFAKYIPQGRIVNILDWRALRPGADHFPYTVSKSALASMTKSLAVALAPAIQVNGLALGAILPPADNPSASEKIIESVPAQRWSAAGEVEEALIFLLSAPAYITGEIIHVDGGRHLV
ncbi:MAG: SDR family oxidoreductase [Anaerolineales bacterium]|nr:SDR family oxidoreductase [Anaerolineales bacterium]